MLFGTLCGCCDAMAMAICSEGADEQRRRRQRARVAGAHQKQSRDFAAHKKELDQLKRELAKANQSGGKPAAAGSSQQAADGGAKKKFWSCVGCSYKENFFSRQTCRECGLQKGSPAALPTGLGATPGVQTAAAAAAAEKAAAA